MDASWRQQYQESVSSIPSELGISSYILNIILLVYAVKNKEFEVLLDSIRTENYRIAALEAQRLQVRHSMHTH